MPSCWPFRVLLCSALCPKEADLHGPFHISRLLGLPVGGTDGKERGAEASPPLPGDILCRDCTYSLALFPSLDRHPMIAPCPLADPGPELQGLHSLVSFLQSRGITAAASL